MNEKEQYRIEEIAKTYNVTKQTIRNRIFAEPIKSEIENYITREGNKILINKDGLKIIASEMIKNPVKNAVEILKENSKENENKAAEYIKQIDDLTKQNEELINENNELIKMLNMQTETNNIQTKINLNMQAELKELKKPRGIFGIFRKKDVEIETQNQGELTDGL